MRDDQQRAAFASQAIDPHQRLRLGERVENRE